jgi:hypothetical protein
LQNRNELITHCPVIVREAQLESQDLVVIHGEVRDAIVQNAIVDRIHSPLISVLWDQKEIHPGKGRKEIRETQDVNIQIFRTMQTSKNQLTTSSDSMNN